mgnify:CR=1 FL=1
MRFYFFILSGLALKSKLSGFGSVILHPFTLFFLVLVALDVYYIILSLFFFEAGSVMLELDLIYRGKPDPSLLYVN